MRTYKIGRLTTNDICLMNDSVSRQHADLTSLDNGTFTLSDHSKNGTTVNGRPINHTTVTLNYGDNVLFAGVAYLDWSKIAPAAPSATGTYDPVPPIYPPQPTSNNGYAIAGFICSFLIPILGLIFSIIGLKKANERIDLKGRGLSIAGIIISSVLMLINLIILIIIIAFS